MLKNLLLIPLSLILMSGVLEITLRTIGWSRPVFTQYDPDIGASYRPNVAGWAVKEDKIFVRTNSHRFRGPEVAVRKTNPSTFRIAVLGDSFTAGFQVEYDELFSSVMGEQLSSCEALGDRPVEILNFGVSGMGTPREILMYRHRAREFTPDLVLLMFNASNDLRNNHPLLEQNDFLPYFVFENGDLVLDASFQENPFFVRKLRYSNPRNRIVNQLRLLQFVNFALVSWFQSRGQRGSDREPTAQGHQLPWVTVTDEVWRESWRLTEAQLAMFALEIKRDDALFVLSATPCCSLDKNGNQVIAGRLQSVADNGGFDFVDLFDNFVEEFKETGRSYLYFDFLQREGGHWNALGHRVAGERLAVHICESVSSPNNG